MPKTEVSPLTQPSSFPRAIPTTLTLAILFLAALLALYHFISTPTIQTLDQTLQSSIHNHANPTLTTLAKTLSFIGSPRTIWRLTIVLSAILYLRRPRRPAYLLALAMAAAGTLETLIKLVVRRPRSNYAWVYVHEHTYSFPSGHATLAIALYGIFFWLTVRTPHPPWQHAAAILAAITLIPAIGLSRIYLGAHYPTDVLAGYLTGAATLALAIAADLAL